jgi:hypothetical protein
MDYFAPLFNNSTNIHQQLTILKPFGWLGYTLSNFNKPNVSKKHAICQICEVVMNSSVILENEFCYSRELVVLSVPQLTDLYVKVLRHLENIYHASNCVNGCLSTARFVYALNINFKSGKLHQGQGLENDRFFTSILLSQLLYCLSFRATMIKDRIRYCKLAIGVVCSLIGSSALRDCSISFISLPLILVFKFCYLCTVQAIVTLETFKKLEKLKSLDNQLIIQMYECLIMTARYMAQAHEQLTRLDSTNDLLPLLAWFRCKLMALANMHICRCTLLNHGNQMALLDSAKELLKTSKINTQEQVAESKFLISLIDSCMPQLLLANESCGTPRKLPIIKMPDSNEFVVSEFQEFDIKALNLFDNPFQGPSLFVPSPSTISIKDRSVIVLFRRIMETMFSVKLFPARLSLKYKETMKIIQEAILHEYSSLHTLRENILSQLQKRPQSTNLLSVISFARNIDESIAQRVEMLNVENTSTPTVVETDAIQILQAWEKIIATSEIGVIQISVFEVFARKFDSKLTKLDTLYSDLRLSMRFYNDVYTLI